MLPSWYGQIKDARGYQKFKKNNGGQMKCQDIRSSLDDYILGDLDSDTEIQ
ncbi:unnamed protein product, partial [marine sediment metagenome]